MDGGNRLSLGSCSAIFCGSCQKNISAIVGTHKKSRETAASNAKEISTNFRENFHHIQFKMWCLCLLCLQTCLCSPEIGTLASKSGLAINDLRQVFQFQVE